MDFALNLGSAYAGLTDLRAQLVDTGGSNTGSAVSSGFTEVASGRYLWHYASFPDDHRGGVKFYSAAASSTILAFMAINPEDGEYNTDLSTLPADVWSYTTRQLTTTANNDVAAVDGSDINITIGATLDATISGLSISASWSKVYFTVKHQHSDADSEAIVQIVVSNPGGGSDGLKYLNEDAATANQGSLTVNQVAGTVRIILADDASVTLEERLEIYYDLKQLVSDGTSSILTSGTCNIVPAVTLSIS